MEPLFDNNAHHDLAHKEWGSIDYDPTRPGPMTWRVCNLVAFCVFRFFQLQRRRVAGWRCFQQRVFQLGWCIFCTTAR